MISLASNISDDNDIELLYYSLRGPPPSYDFIQLEMQPIIPQFHSYTTFSPPYVEVLPPVLPPVLRPEYQMLQMQPPVLPPVLTPVLPPVLRPEYQNLQIQPPVDVVIGKTNNKCAVFIDLSNILNSKQIDKSRFDVSNFVKIIHDKREVLTKVTVGSCRNQPELDKYNRLWSSIDYNGIFTIRAAGMGEQFVDQALQSAIMRFMMDNPSDKTTIVLVSGDGNDNQEACLSFPRVMKMAITQYNFDVEIWSLSESMSRKYHELKNEFKGKVKLRHLDTYIKEFINV